jgi:ubiquinone/menaquinone biosynthesis C-methylase UbiE
MAENVYTGGQVDIPAGIPTTQLYKQLLGSRLFERIETFSNRFLATNQDLLLEYSASWVRDPLHAWSRQWEYPFVFTRIEQFMRQKKSETSILDAGSGVTFFPYCLVSSFDNVKLACCDNDARWGPTFAAINTRTASSVKFAAGDVHDLPFKDDSMDVIYCISVLEHMRSHERVMQEFHRVLVHDGLLLLTFDLSLDSATELSLRQAKKTISMVQSYFPAADPNLKQLLTLFDDKKRLLHDNSVFTFGSSLTLYQRARRNFGRRIRRINASDSDKLTVRCLALRKE